MLANITAVTQNYFVGHFSLDTAEATLVGVLCGIYVSQSYCIVW